MYGNLTVLMKVCSKINPFTCRCIIHMMKSSAKARLNPNQILLKFWYPAHSITKIYKGFLIISVGFWSTRRISTKIAYCSILQSKSDVVANNSSIHLLENITDNGSTYLQKLVTAFRLIYIVILFSPVFILHCAGYIFQSSSIHLLKWRYVRYALQKAGPAFVKLGQWASTRRDLFSADICETLSGLQRDCYTHSWNNTRKIMEENFGPNWEELFTDINTTPIGSGCVAQVYKWHIAADTVSTKIDEEDRTDTDARNLTVPVAVKILHPGVVDSVTRDIYLMRFLALLIDRIYPNFYWISLRECIEEFGIVMLKQVDLQLEAQNMEKFQLKFQSNPQIHFSTPVRPFVTKSVIVESFEEGVHISDYLNIERSSIHQQLAKLGIDLLLSMLFIHNFVHGDLHPGNILVRFPVESSDIPTLVILDCGVATSLSKKDWSNLFDLFTAIVKKEGKKVADLMLDNARYSDCRDIESYRDEMYQLVDDAAKQLNLHRIDVSHLFSNLFEILIKHSVKLESNFASVMLAIMVLEGLGRSLDPELDILESARPFLIQEAKRQIMDLFD